MDDRGEQAGAMWGLAGAGRPLTVGGDGVLEVDTCSGTWLFNLQRSLFCRVPQGTSRQFLPPSAWSHYAKLSLSSSGVVRVILDADAHSGITGWLHADNCSRCAPLQVELSASR